MFRYWWKPKKGGSIYLNKRSVLLFSVSQQGLWWKLLNKQRYEYWLGQSSRVVCFHMADDVVDVICCSHVIDASRSLRSATSFSFNLGCWFARSSFHTISITQEIWFILNPSLCRLNFDNVKWSGIVDSEFGLSSHARSLNSLSRLYASVDLLCSRWSVLTWKNIVRISEQSPVD